MNINRLFRAWCTSLLTMLVVVVVPSVTYAEDVLVFGGTGRLGSETVRQLLTSGYSVAVFARPGASHGRLDALDVTYVAGDLLDPDQVAAAFAAVRPQIVIDASALYSNQHEIEVRHIVAGARRVGVKRIIHHGSVGAGDNMVLFPQVDFTRLEESLRDKGRAEQVLMDSDIPYVIIRNGSLENNDSKSSGSARLTENVTALGPITRRDLAAVTMQCLQGPLCLNNTLHALDDQLASKTE